MATQVFPHEKALRRWLGRTGVQPSDVDDIVQQTYCKLSELDSIAHIRDPRAYLFATARSFVLQHLRRGRVVQIHAASDLIDDMVADDAPSPERIVGDRADLRAVLRAIGALPARYRDVVELRRLEGLTQRETAQRLGISEKAVENNLARGLKAVLNAVENGLIGYRSREEEQVGGESHVAQHR